MICDECRWEAELRKDLAEKRVSFDDYVARPSMRNRGHKVCRERGGNHCPCQHRGTPYAINPGHD